MDKDCETEVGNILVVVMAWHSTLAEILFKQNSSKSIARVKLNSIPVTVPTMMSSPTRCTPWY